MRGEFWHITNRHALDCLIEHLRSQEFGEYGFLVQIKRGQRTTKQRNAMEVYFRILAESLNEAGLDMRKVLKPEIDIPWTQASTKDQLWRPIQISMTGKHSTTQLDRAEVSKVYEPLSRHLGEKFGIFVPFPDRFGR